MTKENLDPTDEESQKLDNSLHLEEKGGTRSNMDPKNKKIGIGIGIGLVALIALIAVIACLSGGDDELEVTDKITFTVATRDDGTFVGSFDIGIFGGMFPVTAKNFIALANGTQSFKYVGSTFPDVRSNEQVIRGGDDVNGGNSGDKSIYPAGNKGNRYWKKDQKNAEFPELKWENVTGADLTKCCRLKGWVAMEDITGDENNPAYNSIFKIFTEDITWDDDDSERDLVFGKVLDNGMDSLEDIKSKCRNKHDCMIQNAVYTRVGQY